MSTGITQAARTFDVVLFYYAGHGFQIDDENYLAPVDARLQNSRTSSSQTIKLSQMTDSLEGAEGTS